MIEHNNKDFEHGNLAFRPEEALPANGMSTSQLVCTTVVLLYSQELRRRWPRTVLTVQGCTASQPLAFHSAIDGGRQREVVQNVDLGLHHTTLLL